MTQSASIRDSNSGPRPDEPLRQPTYDEYAQIMTGYTPGQLPVLSGIARDFGVFDHWFCEVPSQTFMNRSFWTPAT